MYYNKIEKGVLGCLHVTQSQENSYAYYSKINKVQHHLNMRFAFERKICKRRNVILPLF